MEFLGPLRYEWLGLLALGILWVNVLLVAAAALQHRRKLGAVRDAWAAARARGDLVEGEVESGDGPDGALATRRIEQLGRAMTTAGPDRILFTDRSGSGRTHGGVVRAAGEAIDVARCEESDVWIDDRAPSRRDEDDFASAWSRASTNKGVASTIEQRIAVGDRVWVDRARPRIAAMDPIALVDRRRAMLLGFAAADVLGCAAVTAIALWPPALGPVSTIGGVLGVAYFLAITPIANAVRDAAKIPPDRAVGGIWQRDR